MPANEPLLLTLVTVVVAEPPVVIFFETVLPSTGAVPGPGHVATLAAVG
jgi:hypothetical protein